MLHRARVLAALLLVASGLPAGARPGVHSGPHSGPHSGHCRVTLDAYTSLKHGTRYGRAVKILGCPGRRVTHMAIGKVRRATYTWRGTGRTGANLTLSFRNGHLMSKSQLGLH